MSHFDIGDWADYVRGISSGTATREMARHLETACPECVATWRWLKQVTAVAKSSVAVNVPPALLRRAENLFEQPSVFQFGSLFPLIANLVFDAGSNFQPVGIRTSGAIDHTLHQAGDFLIDLRQESIRGTARISMVGQISHSGQSSEPAVISEERDSEGSNSRFPVALFSGASILSNVLSNTFGEFSLTYRWRPNLKLAIAVTNTGRRIDIPLTRVSRDKSPDKEE